MLFGFQRYTLVLNIGYGFKTIKKTNRNHRLLTICCRKNEGTGIPGHG
jgi:hypothetical protein